MGVFLWSVGAAAAIVLLEVLLLPHTLAVCDKIETCGQSSVGFWERGPDVIIAGPYLILYFFNGNMKVGLVGTFLMLISIPVFWGSVGYFGMFYLKRCTPLLSLTRRTRMFNNSGMKLFLGVFFCAVLFSTVSFADAPKTKEDFVAAVKTAFEAKDTKKIRELVYEKGQSDFDNKQEEQILPMMVKQLDGTETFTIEPLPADMETMQIAMGRKIEPTHAPDGVLKVQHTSADGNSKWSFTLPYAQIDGVFYITGTKSTDLGWKGPEDKLIVVNVHGADKDKLKAHIKYNASGVDQERNMKYPSATLMVQSITEITVTNDDDSATLQLEIETRDGSLHYQSAPLKGKGVITYHKGDKSAPESSGMTPEQ